jgi:hypothetical protein
MNNNTQTQSPSELFKKIAKEFPKSEVSLYKGKLGFCRLQKTAIHYELQHYSLVSMIGIELHIEKENDYEKKDYEVKKAEVLQKYLKYFTDVKIRDKHIMYDPCWYDCGKIYILCDYSMGEKKILSYINEFIYQTRERINVIVPGWEE